jgi:hypothetical protein
MKRLGIDMLRYDAMGGDSAVASVEDTRRWGQRTMARSIVM